MTQTTKRIVFPNIGKYPLKISVSFPRKEDAAKKIVCMFELTEMDS